MMVSYIYAKSCVLYSYKDGKMREIEIDLRLNSFKSTALVSRGGICHLFNLNIEHF